MTRELDALKDRINRSGKTRAEIGRLVAAKTGKKYSRPEAVVSQMFKRKTKSTPAMLHWYNLVLDEIEQVAPEPRLPDSSGTLLAEVVTLLTSCNPEQLEKIADYASLVCGIQRPSHRR